MKFVGFCLLGFCFGFLFAEKRMRNDFSKSSVYIDSLYFLFFLKESDYFTPQGEFRVDKAGSPTLLNCLMYKMSYYRFGEMQVSATTSTGS